VRPSLLIQDALLVTVNPQDDVLRGDLLVEDGRIVAVGPSVNESTQTAQRVIDGRALIALPGLVNAHSHLFNSAVKGDEIGRPLEIWRRLSEPAWRSMPERLVYAAALVGCLEMLRSGTTAVLDHDYSDTPHGSGVDSVVRAILDSGIRASVALAVADDAGAAAKPETLLERSEQFVVRYRDAHPRLAPMLGPAAPQRCTDRLFTGCAELAERYDIGVHTHLLETRLEALECRRRYGKSAIGHLSDMGVLNTRLSLAHSVWLEQDDLVTLAASGAIPVHNPASNLRLGSGIAPVPSLLAAGIPVALGTDGASSNDTQSMFDGIRLAGLIHTIGDPDYRRWLTPRQVLRMATMGGAKALGRADEIGSLEPGKQADIVLLRATSPAFVPLNDVYAQIVACASEVEVDAVIVDGQLVFEHGRSTLIDEGPLYGEVMALSREFVDSWAHERRGLRSMEDGFRREYLEAMSDRANEPRWLR
jgi:cytosine/adenosine deaminase-related metal-dependent hydrolase